MDSGFGRRLALTVGLLILPALFMAEEGAGQVVAVGGQLTLNPDIAEDITWGIGARAHLSLPLTGITLQGTADFFRPDCGALECDFREVSVNVLWSLPVPFVATPYFGAGVAMQNREGEGGLGDDSDYGANFLGGIILGGVTFNRFKPFGEIKYQMMQDFDAQTVYSFGVLMSIF